MPALVTVQLERADVPNRNGRVYPKALLERVARQNQVTELPVFEAPFETATLNEFIGMTKSLEVKDNALQATVQLVETEAGRAVSTLLECGYSGVFCMNGHGSVVDGVVQADYQIDGICLDWGFIQDARLRKLLRSKMKGYRECRRAEEDSQHPTA